MAHWGIAYAAGPNYNKQWKAFDPNDLKRSLDTAHHAAKRALELVDGASSVERALIRSLEQRYPSSDPEEVTAIWNDNYANFMREVYRAHPDDHDIGALFAEAIMNRTPWQLWDIKSGKPADGADTLEAIAVLEAAMTQPGGMQHPGLRRDNQDGNQPGNCADRKYLAREGANNFYALYRGHNFHFKLYGAMLLGQLQPALEAADEMIASLPADLLRIESPPMADWLEGFLMMKLHVERHYRDASSRRPRVVLCRDFDDPLCKGRRPCS